jgi:hypothetical protein
VAAPELTSAGWQGLELRNTWQCRSSPLEEVELRAIGHMVAPEPTLAERRGPELRNMWQRQSSTQQGGEARVHGTHGSIRVHLGRKARSGVAGHVEVPELTSTGRRDPELQGMWQREDAHPAPCLDLKLVCGGTRHLGCRQVGVEVLLPMIWWQVLSLLLLVEDANRILQFC